MSTANPSTAQPGAAAQQDPAASFRRHTARQARHAGARFDREARAAIEAHEAEQRSKVIAGRIARAHGDICLWATVTLNDSIDRKDGTRRPLRRDERAFLDALMDEAWRTLRRYGAGVVTVLA